MDNSNVEAYLSERLGHSLQDNNDLNMSTLSENQPIISDNIKLNNNFDYMVGFGNRETILEDDTRYFPYKMREDIHKGSLNNADRVEYAIDDVSSEGASISSLMNNTMNNKQTERHFPFIPSNSDIHTIENRTKKTFKLGSNKRKGYIIPNKSESKGVLIDNGNQGRQSKRTKIATNDEGQSLTKTHKEYKINDEFSGKMCFIHLNEFVEGYLLKNRNVGLVFSDMIGTYKKSLSIRLKKAVSNIKREVTKEDLGHLSLFIQDIYKKCFNSNILREELEILKTVTSNNKYDEKNIVLNTAYKLYGELDLLESKIVHSDENTANMCENEECKIRSSVDDMKENKRNSSAFVNTHQGAYLYKEDIENSSKDFDDIDNKFSLSDSVIFDNSMESESVIDPSSIRGGSKRVKECIYGILEKSDRKVLLGSNKVDASYSPGSISKKLHNKRRDKIEQNIMEERKLVYTNIAKKLVPRIQKNWMVSQHNLVNNTKKVSSLCCREVRRIYFKINRFNYSISSGGNLSVGIGRESIVPYKSRKNMKEMFLFWRKNEREEKEHRKRNEKLEMEKRKIEEEANESRRQARKLNFLINQTELYSHFIAKKVGTQKIQLDTDTSASGDASTFDIKNQDINMIEDHILEEQAKRNAVEAINKQNDSIIQFDKEVNHDETGTYVSNNGLLEQPKILYCRLKEYQIKGLNWLVNLYEQGINGILADEMGLGKTVQSIALLAYLIETKKIQGPFLVVTPASTLHNWQQEIHKFVPSMNILPYWGSLKDRKTLRKFLLGFNNSSFRGPGRSSSVAVDGQTSHYHVVITSYQIVITDEKYFQRVKWQYMILDEAQAIKSSSSLRWKTLLGLNCRNRLLLTGTPIQNSMQELWSLLHFIMPMLFDSHDEFNEWFSKDIESQVENNGSYNEKQLQRLRMILKPFMLRRIKKDVENELEEKVEVNIFCNLSYKQMVLYNIVKRKIKTEHKDMLSKLSSSDFCGNNKRLDSLMNLVMQFRKICNHPELIERSHVYSPFYFCSDSYFLYNSSDCYMNNTDYVSKGIRNPIEFYIPKCMIGITRDKSVLEMFNILSIRRMYERLYCGVDNDLGILSLVSYDMEILRLIFKYPLSANIFEEIRGGKSEHFLYFSSIYDTLRIVKRMFSLLYIAKVISGPVDVVYGDVASQKMHETMMEVDFGKKVIMDRCRHIYNSSFSETYMNYPFEIRTKYKSTNQGYINVIQSRPLLHFDSRIIMPGIRDLIHSSGKLKTLELLLKRLYDEGHRVLIYFQMTKMIDLMEDFLKFKKYKYIRLDGSSKISDRRDLVEDFQTENSSIFIFLLSTRAGGLGINLTAADTVIFYDSDWNPTVDQQAMDRAHRLGQTKTVTVYRLITRNTIEEKIINRANIKHEIQKVVISGNEFCHFSNDPDSNEKEYDADCMVKGGNDACENESVMELRSKDIVSMLLDEEGDMV